MQARELFAGGQTLQPRRSRPLFPVRLNPPVSSVPSVSSVRCPFFDFSRPGRAPETHVPIWVV
jgi:hypothetical protein